MAAKKKSFKGKKQYAVYKAENRRNRNKKRNLKRHLKKLPNDKQAARALDKVAA